MKTSKLLKKYGVKLKKSLGQNFLSDQRIAKKIVDLSGVSSKDVVIEIGAGAGTLTEELAKVVKRVVAYEVDKSLERLLKDRLSIYSNVELVFEDFLKANLPDVKDFVYVANIPYSITGLIIEKILRENRFKFAVLMVQKEVAERMISKPGRRAYGYLSALVQSYCDVKKLFDVSKSNFVPNPKVDSTVLKLVWNGTDLDFDKYSKFLSKSFEKKRKTLRNNLKSFLKDPDEILGDIDVDLNMRPEQISAKDFQRIFAKINPNF